MPRLRRLTAKTALTCWLAMISSGGVSAQDISAEPSVASPGLERSMSFQVEQSAAERVQSITEQLSSATPEAEQEAVRLLQQMLAASEGWVPGQKNFEGSYAYARRTIASLTPAGKAAYIRFAEPLAKQSLESGLLRHDPDSLRVCAVQFPETPSGKQAGVLWKSFLQDQGWPELATAGFDVEKSSSAAPIPDSPVIANIDEEISKVPNLEQPLPDSLRIRMAAEVQLARANGRHPVPVWDLKSTGEELFYRTPLGTSRLQLRTREQTFEAAPSLTELTAPGSPLPLEGFFFDRFMNTLAVSADLYLHLRDRGGENAGDYDLVASRGTETVWQITAEQIGGRILSPPAAGLERIWILTESTEGHVSLVSFLPETGRVMLQVPLGQSLIPWKEDLPRQGRAAWVFPGSTCVFCLTGSGAIVAIDPTTGTRLWGVRISRDDTLGIDFNQKQQVQDVTRWSKCRQPQVLLQSEYLICLLPESDRILGLDPASGATLFRIPSWQDDRLVSFDNHQLLIDSISALRSVRLPDGDLAWVRNCQEPHGRGVLHRGDWYFPTEAGLVRRLPLPTDESASTEIFLSSQLKPSAWKPPTEQGTFLPVQLGVIGHQVCRLTLNGITPVDTAEVIDHLTACEEAEYSLIAQLASALQAEDWSRAADISLQAISTNEDAPVLPTNTMEKRSCRLDRLLQGEIEHVYSSLSSEKQSACEDEFLAALGRLLAAETSSATRILNRAGEFPWVWRARVANKFPVMPPGEQAALQIQLLRQSEVAPEPWAALASFRLAEFHLGRGEWRLASTFLNSVSKRSPPILDHPEFSSLVDRSELEAVEQQIVQQSQLTMEWALGIVPEVHRTERFSIDIFQDPLPRCGSRPGSAGFGEVSIKWPGGTELQWKQSSWPTTCLEPIPAPQNSVRARRGLNRVWELGNLCVVQAGAEVFGLWQQSAVAMPEMRRLWPAGTTAVTTLTHPSLQPQGIEASIPYQGGPSFRDEEVSTGVSNLFGQPIGVVGPVNTQQVLLRQEASLCALDPVDGSLLWKTWDVSYLDRVLSDPARVVLTFNDPVLGDYARDLSPCDGRLLREYPLPMDPDLQILKCYRSAMLGQRLDEEHGLIISLQGVGETEPGWNRRWDRSAVPFSVNDQLFGMADPGSGIELISIETGETVSQLTMNLPTERFDVFCTTLNDVFLIGISHDPGNEFLETVDTRLMRHRRFLDGALLAVDRKTGSLLWEQKFQETFWNLNQSADLPVFIINEPRRDQDGFWRSSRLRVYDLLTGALLLSEESLGPKWINVVISGHLARQVVRIRAQNEMIELRYRESKHQ